jgi:two-component system sensor histidine kinase HydH
MDSLSPAKLVLAVSHEIRNPLSSIKMAVQTVAGSSGLSDRDKRRLALANREIRTIERLLGLLSESARDTPLATERIPPRQLVDEALSLIAKELEERGLSVKVDPQNAPQPATMDPFRLRPVLAQVILNLALSGEDGQSTTIVVDGERGGPSIGVTAATHLEPADLPKVFDPTATFLAPGTGLSLWVLRNLMVLHGGTLSASERPGAGVLFTLAFPA